MTTAIGDCHVCGAEAVGIHLLAACDRCHAAAGRFSYQPAPGVRRSRKTAVGAHDAAFCCSFCGRRPEEVRKIFSGPWTLICDGCVALAAEAMRADLGDDWNPYEPQVPEPPAPVRSGKTWPGRVPPAGAFDERREITAVGPPPVAPAPRKTPRARR